MFERWREPLREETTLTEWPPEIGFAQWQGTREFQTDVGFVSGYDSDRGILMALADGIGLDATAGQAAAGAVSAMRRVYEQEEPVPEMHRQVLRMLGEAHEAVRSMNEELQNRGEMPTGATLACALIRHRRLSFGAVGNVRVFLLRSGGLLQLNRDHLLSLEAEERDILAGRAPDVDTERAMRVTAYAGMDGLRQLDWQQGSIPLLADDLVILMSSGLYGVLPEEEFTELILSDVPQNAAELVIQRVVHTSNPASQSNVSLMVLRMNSRRRRHV